MSGKVTHSLFTVIAPVSTGQQDALRAKLETLDYVGREPSDDVFGFKEIGTLHYASMFLYEDPADGWQFVLECNTDGEISVFLDRLIAVVGTSPRGQALLLELYGNCAGFDGGDLPSLRDYMAAHVNAPAAAFAAGIGLSRDRIITDAAIHKVVDNALNSGLPALSVDEAQDAVFKALADDPVTRNFTDQTGDSGNELSLEDRIRSYVNLALGIVGILVFAIAGRARERGAEEDNTRPDLAKVRDQKRYEDHGPSNHMASIVHLHTDWLRQTAKRVAFKFLIARATLNSRDGNLSNIETIHFAHWAYANNNRRLLFVSNYDGNWDSYLDDFTLKASTGLTLSWVHGVGLPKTRFMLHGGAAEGPKFIDWARRSMVPCPVWYNAYPGLSVNNVIRNKKLRAALAEAKAGTGGAEWLKHV